MSRREEVKNKLISCRNVIDRGTLARTLADEVDAERAIVTKLLEMLEPGVEPNDFQFCFNLNPDGDFKAAHDAWKGKAELHARACEIAGREE